MRKIVLIFTMLVQLVFAQSNTVADQDQYLKSLQARVVKIVAPLGIEKEKQSQKVHALVLSQYQTLSRIHGERDAKAKALRSTSVASKDEMKSLEAAVEMDANKEITKMHDLFLHRLGRRLKAEQVDAVKDGMTYHVAPNTYKGYQEMLPTLTALQKEKIWNWLKEAREIAMDAETSEKKHWWFGKYKGRINNYLSAEGFDMKKASEAWQKTIKTKSVKTVN
jgi:hypothetical protein